ncbi:MAG: hypothetical protein U9M95_00090 [Candidatus Altiarchaeota archaeon]|nr:hypothetical protein [Candidatus Altiarchaeota archaeon]
MLHFLDSLIRENIVVMQIMAVIMATLVAITETGPMHILFPHSNIAEPQEKKVVVKC